MRIVFMGTPEFAVPSLNKLIKDGYNIVAVVTQPDKPKGRGNKVSQTPVKEFALQHQIQVFQPNKIRNEEFYTILREAKPDLLVTAAYGKILSKEILNIPKMGCVNVHASLLPSYRGAAPIHWSVIHGAKMSGVTTMLTDIGVDTGPMLLKTEVEISDDMTSGELHDILMEKGGDLLSLTIRQLEAGTIKPVAQPEEGISYAPVLSKDVGHIKWNQNTWDIHNLVRGTNPRPGAYTYFQGHRMRVWVTRVEKAACTKMIPGTVTDITKDGIYVATKDGLIRLIEIQFDSCRRMSVSHFICGHEIHEGDRFE